MSRHSIEKLCRLIANSALPTSDLAVYSGEYMYYLLMVAPLMVIDWLAKQAKSYCIYRRSVFLENHAKIRIFLSYSS